MDEKKIMYYFFIHHKKCDFYKHIKIQIFWREKNNQKAYSSKIHLYRKNKKTIFTTTTILNYC